jgi:hypothetical protein
MLREAMKRCSTGYVPETRSGAWSCTNATAAPVKGGIDPAQEKRIVHFFNDPLTGHRHGYCDGWGEDGFYHYYGAGQRGDQTLGGRNGSILSHREMGRSLEGYLGSGGVVTYLGEFEVVDYYFTEAHETGDVAAIRQVVVFFQVTTAQQCPSELAAPALHTRAAPQVDVVSVEAQHAGRAHRPEGRAARGPLPVASRAALGPTRDWAAPGRRDATPAAMRLCGANPE